MSYPGIVRESPPARWHNHLRRVEEPVASAQRQLDLPAREVRARARELAPETELTVVSRGTIGHPPDSLAGTPDGSA